MIVFYKGTHFGRQKRANTASRTIIGIMHPNPEEHRGRWWDASRARFHLCLPKSIGTTCGKAVSPRPACTVQPWPGSPGRAGTGERGAGRQFVWLGVGSGKAALSRPAHQPPSGMLRDGYPCKPRRGRPLTVRCLTDKKG